MVHIRIFIKSKGGDSMNECCTQLNICILALGSSIVSLVASYAALMRTKKKNNDSLILPPLS